MTFFGIARSSSAVGSEWTCPQVPPIAFKDQDKPNVDGAVTFINGEVKPWEGETIEITSPIVDPESGKRTVIGRLSMLEEDDAVEVVKTASTAWDAGQGAWPQMPVRERIAAMEAVLEELTHIREDIVQVLMWEICKNTGDAYKEFDRTMDYARASIATLKESIKTDDAWKTVSGVRARVRRGPVGVNLMLAPFNYPLNEMYAMLIPSLLMGNVVVLKLPAVGGLVHILTMNAFAKHLPRGSINFVSGSGRVTCGAIMRTGLVDMLGFIGGSNAADKLIGAHPHVHRLKIFSQLEGKNLGIVLPDADLDVAAKQCTLGATSYNGQRCTAIKLIMVHDSVKEQFMAKLHDNIVALKVGLPWEDNVAITPLPEPKKPAYLEALIADAVEQGASVVNSDHSGGQISGGSLFTPALVYPVTPSMRLFNEEQFGPVIPVATFADTTQVYDVLRNSWNGQQASIFTSDPTGLVAAPLVDLLSNIVGRVNLNVQCGRSPDVLPFSGRRSSAMGTMSVSEALRGFSIETVVAFAASSETSAAVAGGLDKASNFLAAL